MAIPPPSSSPNSSSHVSAEDMIEHLAKVLALHLCADNDFHIYAHLNFVSDFISDAIHLGVGGYAIASFQFALSRLRSTHIIENEGEECGCIEDTS